MVIKSFLMAASAMATLSPSPKPSINRGRIWPHNGQVTIQGLGDNRQLKAAGVKENDILVSVCDVQVINLETYKQGDAKLQTSEYCPITVLRNGVEINASYSKEN